MNAFISISLKTNQLRLLCIFIYAGGRKDTNGTAPTIVVVSLKTESVLIDGLLLSMLVVEEADTIIGTQHQPVIVSLTERKSRLSLIYKVG